MFNEFVVSTRIRAARNVSGYALPAGTDDEDRKQVREVLCGAFERFEGELAGKFYDLGTLSDEDRNMLLENGFLFQIPKTTNLLWHAGAARNWPMVSILVFKLLKGSRTALVQCQVLSSYLRVAAARLVRMLLFVEEAWAGFGDAPPQHDTSASTLN